MQKDLMLRIFDKFYFLFGSEKMCCLNFKINLCLNYTFFFRWQSLKTFWCILSFSICTLSLLVALLLQTALELNPGLGSLCMDCACFLCACMDSLLVLLFPSRVQNHGEADINNRLMFLVSFKILCKFVIFCLPSTQFNILFQMYY